MRETRFVIRPYRAETDLARLSAIWFEASVRAHPFIGKTRLSRQRQRVERDYFPSARTFVALVEDEPVGFISLLGDFVGALFVRPDRQGQGFGRALLEHALAETPLLELEVYAANQAALGFYRSMGFREVSRRSTDDDGLPFESVRMRYGD